MYDVLAILVNYNSMHIINIVKKLLQGLHKLGSLVSLKLILVDNNSTDRSFEELNGYITEYLDIDVAILKLGKNYGFTRAVNIAYRYAIKRWRIKYLALLNNDIIIVPENIVKVLEYLEYTDIAGVQGTIMQMQNPNLIDNAGFLIDQNGLTYPVCRGYTMSCAKLYAPSFLSGACSFYRVDIIMEKLELPFNSAIESYYDDKYLGLSLWYLGYKLIHVPLIVAYHLGTATYASSRKTIIAKGPRWFKGIVLADLLPNKKSNLNMALIALIYLYISYGISILAQEDYVKSVIEALREAVEYSKSDQFKEIKNNLARVPFIKKVLPIRLYNKGIKVKKSN